MTKICKLECRNCNKTIGIVKLNPDDDPMLEVEEGDYDRPVNGIRKYNNILLRNINYMFIFCSQECCDKYKEENKNG